MQNHRHVVWMCIGTTIKSITMTCTTKTSPRGVNHIVNETMKQVGSFKRTKLSGINKN